LGARGVDVRCVDVPGRFGSARKEPWGGTLVDMAREIADEVRCMDFDAPVFYFGHSIGAWLAYETATRQPPHSAPAKLYTSGVRAPSVAHWLNDLDRTNPRLSLLEGDAFWDAFNARYGENMHLTSSGTRNAMFSSLVNDFRLSETYEPSAERVECDIVAIGTRGDSRYDAHQLGMWRHHTSSAYDERWFVAANGVSPHRLVVERPDDVAAFLAQDISDTVLLL
jgi:pyochelin biosynthetic protein PchC